MFFSKLRPNDSFGLIVFNTKGEILIPCQPKKDLVPDELFKIIDSIHQNGGTTLMSGFDEAKRNLLRYFNSQNYSKNDAA